MRWRGGVLCVLAMLCALVLAAPAGAEVRTGSAPDPVDSDEATLSGAPSNPDLSGGALVYDTGGSFTVAASFYHSLNDLDTSQNYAFFVRFSIGVLKAETAYDGAIRQTCSGELYGSFWVRAPLYTSYRRAFSVVGLDGSAPISVTIAPDGRSVSASGSAPAIAGRDWRCFRLNLAANRRSSYLNEYSSYDEGCECWAVNNDLDVLGEVGETAVVAAPIWFSGYAPPPDLPAPGKRKKLKLEEGTARWAIRTALYEKKPGWRYMAGQIERVCDETSTTRQVCHIYFKKGGFQWDAKAILTATEPQPGGPRLLTYRLKLSRENERCGRRTGRSIPCTKALGTWTGGYPLSA